MKRRYSKEQLSLIVRKNIRKYRKIRKYTLQELADLTGLTHGYVRDLECLSIDKTPLLETVGKFADALEIDNKKRKALLLFFFKYYEFTKYII